VTEERPLAADTPLAAEHAQFAIWRRMTPTEKFAAFLDLQQTAIALAEAGIRLRHPHADEREVFLRRVARTLDRATVLRLYGWAPDADG
jgi:hypothetical protein